MLNVYLSDGRTLRFDLQDETSSRAWAEAAADSSFQAQITGMSLSFNGNQYALPKPQGFDRTFYFAERVEADPARKIKGGERITCQSGDVAITMMAHAEQHAVRVDVARVGKQRYNPLAR